MKYEEAVASFEYGEGPKYVLTIHGFTGTPYEMRELALYLAAQGFHVIGSRLPGHGQNKEVLAKTQWQDWWNEIKRNFEAIKAKNPSHIFVTGFSLGGVLNLYATANCPEITAIALINAPAYMRMKGVSLLPLLNLIMTYTPKVDLYEAQDPNFNEDPIFQETNRRYDKDPLPTILSAFNLMKNVRKHQLSKIRQPILIVQSRKDQTIRANSASLFFKHVATKPKDKSVLWLENSGHAATMDYDKEQLFSEITKFFKKYSS